MSKLMLFITWEILSMHWFFIKEDIGNAFYNVILKMPCKYYRNSTQNPEIFRLGIKRATKAIKNAIGAQVQDYFNTMSDIVSIIPQSVLAQPPHQIRSPISFSWFLVILCISANLQKLRKRQCPKKLAVVDHF